MTTAALHDHDAQFVRRERSLSYQPALDGVRGVAVAGVLLFHGGHLRGGYLGVDAFFVLSGYLITSILLVEVAATGAVSFANFYARRLRRLMPAIVLVIACVGVYAKFIAEPRELNAIRFDGLATLFYFANWRAIVAGTDYWAAFRAPSPFRHTWSLAIEEQFYFVWPMLVWVVSRVRPNNVARTVRVVAVGGCALSFAAMQIVFHATNTNRAYFGTDTRVASIFVGAILATISVKAIERVVVRAWRVALELGALVACVVIAREWMKLDGQNEHLYRGGLLALAVLVGVVIVAAVHPTRGVIYRALAFAPVRGLGVISYGVYLWHWPIFVWMSASRMHRTGWPLLAMQLGVTLVVATISYHVVERPIRHGRGHRRVVWAAVPIAAVVTTSALVFATSGYLAPALARQRPDAIPQRHVVVHPGTQQPERILVVGNSIAYFLGDEGFRSIRNAKNRVVLNRGITGCRFFADIAVVAGPNETQGVPTGGPSCQAVGEWALAVQNFQPDFVILVMSEASDARLTLHGRATNPCQLDYREYTSSVLRADIGVLHSSGAAIAVVTAATSAFPFSPREWFVNNRCNNEIIRGVSRDTPGARLVDLEKWMCPDSLAGCVNEKEGVRMRTDLVHYRGRAAEIAAAWILRQLVHPTP